MAADGDGAAAAGQDAGAAGAGAGAAGGATGTAGGQTAGATASWRDTLPEGLKGDKGLEKFKDPGALAQSYLELEKSARASVKIPGKDATPEAIAAWREKIGVPKAPSDYTLTVPDPKTGQTIDAKRWEAAVPFFHKHNFSQAQVQALAEWAVTEEAGRAAQVNQGHVDALNALADTWGAQTFDRRAQLAERVVDRFATPEMRQKLHAAKAKGEPGIFHTNHPELFQMLAAIGEQFAEEGIIDGQVNGLASPDQVKDKIAAIRKELADLGGHTGSPRYRDLQEQLNEQYKILNPA